MKRAIVAGLALALLIGGPVMAKVEGSCSISPNPAVVGETYIVAATGLPTDSTLNLYVTDPSGTSVGIPLGSTPDGNENLTESSPSAGTWTYSFQGPDRGNGNAKVYAQCSVEVQ